MFPSASLEERRLAWLALRSVNHALVSRKEIFRACSCSSNHPSIHLSIYPSISKSLHQTRVVPVTPSSLPMLPSSLWVRYLLLFPSLYTPFPAATPAMCSLGKPLAKPETTG